MAPFGIARLRRSPAPRRAGREIVLRQLIPEEVADSAIAGDGIVSRSTGLDAYPGAPFTLSYRHSSGATGDEQREHWVRALPPEHPVVSALSERGLESAVAYRLRGPASETGMAKLVMDGKGRLPGADPNHEVVVFYPERRKDGPTSARGWFGLRWAGTDTRIAYKKVRLVRGAVQEVCGADGVAGERMSRDGPYTVEIRLPAGGAKDMAKRLGLLDSNDPQNRGHSVTAARSFALPDWTGEQPLYDRTYAHAIQSRPVEYMALRGPKKGVVNWTLQVHFGDHVDSSRLVKRLGKHVFTPRLPERPGTVELVK